MGNIDDKRRGRIVKYPQLMLGGFFTCLTVCMALAYVFGFSEEVLQYNIALKLQDPSGVYWLGTDVYGRDVFSLLMGSSFNALRVSLSAIAGGLVIGVFLGVFSALCKGYVDALLMRFCEFMFAFPTILLAILFIAAFGPGAKGLILAIGVANIPVFARVTRNAIGNLQSKEFILSAKALGRSSFGIFRAHFLPYLMPLLITQSTLQLSLAILAEATLTYLNLGVQAPAPSWGRMLYEAQTLLYSAPMLAIIPGCALALAVLGFNLLGSGLRDLWMTKHRLVKLF